MASAVSHVSQEECADDEEDELLVDDDGAMGEDDGNKRIKHSNTDRECFDVFKQIQAREKQASGFVGTEGAEKHAKITLDREEVIECLNAKPAEGEPGHKPLAGDIPAKTLYELFHHPSVQEDLQSDRIWIHLWKLVVRLRTEKGQGCDTGFIKNHRTCRMRTANLNWHQQLEHACRLVNMQNGLSANRISRMQAWKTIAASNARKVLQMDADALPDTFHAGQVVLALPPMEPPAWRVAVVLAVWVIAGKKVKPTHLPMPTDKVHSMRLCLMDPVEGDMEGTFRAHSESISVVATPFRVACVLGVESESPHSDCFQCKLDQDSLHAVQRAHLIKHWPKNLLEKADGSAPAKTSTAPGVNASPKARKRTRDVITSPQIVKGKHDKPDDPASPEKKDKKDKKAAVEEKENPGKGKKPTTKKSQTQSQAAVVDKEISFVPGPAIFPFPPNVRSNDLK